MKKVKNHLPILVLALLSGLLVGSQTARYIQFDLNFFGATFVSLETIIATWILSIVIPTSIFYILITYLLKKNDFNKNKRNYK